MLPAKVTNYAIPIPGGKKKYLNLINGANYTGIKE